MPEEPDLSPVDIDILDRNLRQRIDARKEVRRREADEINDVADRIMAALQTRPDGMRLAEIRALFDQSHSDEQIQQALRILVRTPATRQKVEKRAESTGERFLLAAS
jgi:hypothetical protein